MAFRAFSSHDDFIRPDTAAAGSLSPQRGNLEPFEVFHDAATVADKVMVGMKQRIVPRGAGVELEFADQTGFHQRMQSVVHGGAGGADPAFVQRGPKLVDGGMVGMAQEVPEKGDSLRRAAQSGRNQRFVDVGCQLIRHSSKIRLNSNEAQD